MGDVMGDEEFKRHVGEDLWFGSSRGPSIAARLQRVEDEQQNMSEQVGKIESTLTWGIRLLIGILITGLVDVLVQALKH